MTNMTKEASEQLMQEFIADSRKGALYGLAIGDALGAPIEFRRPGNFSPITEYRSGGPHSLAKGQWTDDTSMTLALANSIGRGWNLDDQMKEYVEWYQNGKYSINGWCFDIGGTTRSSLENYMADGDVMRAAERYEGASGNGSIMRLAPVAIKYYDLFPSRVVELAQKADESSLVTHGSWQCRSACRYMAVVLAALIQGEDRGNVLSPDWVHLEAIHKVEPLEPKVLAVARGSYRSKAAKIEGSGWVVQSLEAALWAFHDAKDFSEAVLKAVNLGDDSDTTGAVCGQFAGAYFGYDGIPASLKEGLDRKDMIEAALSSIM